MISFDPREQGPTLVLGLSDEVYRLCIEKGSIAIDGISLTIARKSPGNRIEIAVVAHTLAHTTMASYRAGRRVNVEADVIAKYVREFVRQENV